MKILIVTPAFNPPHGGFRMIFEWASRLTKWHSVTVHSLKGGVCDWFKFSTDVRFQDTYDPSGFDCLIVTSPHSVQLTERPDCPPKVFLFIQMLEHLFRPQDAAWFKTCQKFYTSPHPAIFISQWNIRECREKFGRLGPCFHVGNGVNFNDFPVERPEKPGNLVLVEGWEPGINPAKDAASVGIKVAARLKKDGYRILAYGHQPLKTFPELVSEYHYQPTTYDMNSLYRRASILLKATKYDARACAPLEAMTKGTPTARAIVEGDDDLIHEVNCLRTPYEVESLYQAAKKLLTNQTLRTSLVENCYQHLRENSWENWMTRVNEIITGNVKPRVKTIVVSVVYSEPEWERTHRNLLALGVPVVFVARRPEGVGSLAEAINRGFRDACARYDFDYVWFVTNIWFGKSAVPQLEAALDTGKFAAVHPAFDSDHAFCRKRPGSTERVEVPFVEFTAPIVRREVMEKFPLDEAMPYWGHDLDWGVRVRAAGLKIGVDYGCTVEHSYIRNKAKTGVTAQRAALRKQTDESTIRRMEEKYGDDWKVTTGYRIGSPDLK